LFANRLRDPIIDRSEAGNPGAQGLLFDRLGDLSFDDPLGRAF
jgi:hypothetical protein